MLEGCIGSPLQAELPGTGVCVMHTGALVWFLPPLACPHWCPLHHSFSLQTRALTHKTTTGGSASEGVAELH